LEKIIKISQVVNIISVKPMKKRLFGPTKGKKNLPLTMRGVNKSKPVPIKIIPRQIATSLISDFSF
jgi:hypothetical protein